MYLAPLNYDRFFQKVFSQLHIAKRFLEDFLEVEIQKIELLDKSHYLTDDAKRVEFDYSCTIGNSDVIIDMQQWYKTDVVKRFYTYHAAGTVLQLKKLPSKSLPTAAKEKKTTEDYSRVKPVITLIWMVDDTLKYEENYVAFTMTPEQVTDFLHNQKLWDNPEINKIIEERNKVLKISSNTTKELDYLSKNRLIFLFQRRIVKSKQLAKYIRWFQFADKTADKENTKEDFVEFEKDSLFHEIMFLLAKDNLDKDELSYLTTEEEYRKQIDRFVRGEYNYGYNDAINESKQLIAKEKLKRIAAEKQKAEAEKQKAEAEKQKAEAQQREAEALQREAEAQQRERIKDEKLKTAIRNLAAKKININDIAETFNVDVEFIKMVIESK